MFSRDTITDREAWRLFQIAAVSEALSWILLLIGILIKYVIHPGNDTWVAIGGSIHGTIFLGYAVAVLGLFRILRLSFWQVLFAAAASVIPFGTLIFERWLAAKRAKAERGSFRQVVVRGVIKQGKQLLALQQSDVSYWCLPGTALEKNESPEHSLVRTITEQTGVVPIIGTVKSVQQYSQHGNLILQLFYTVTNVQDFVTVFPLGGRYERPGLDEIAFVSSSTAANIDGSLFIT